MEKKKYNYGQGIKINEVPKEEMSLAISEWAEGNENLQNAITSCVENGIPTMASCAGHSIMDSPYIAMQINEGNVGNILNLVNRFSNEPHTQIGFVFNNNSSSLTIYGNMLNRNKCFNIIASESENSLNIEEVNELTRSLWETYTNLKNHRGIFGELYNSMQYINGSLKKRLLITPYSHELQQSLNETRMKVKEDIVGKKVMVKSSVGNKKIIETLDDITSKIQKNFTQNPMDEKEDSSTSKENLSFDERIQVSLPASEKPLNCGNAIPKPIVQKGREND